MDGTVLVADDDSTIRTVLTQALTRAGCKVHATSSLTTLMRWVGEGRGDAVITDVMMPDGNGLEMLPKIAQDRPGLPVIVISAQNTIMTAIRANEAEAFDYLPKPFDLPDLMKRTARALAGTAGRAPAPETREAPDALPLIGQTPVMQTLYKLVARVIGTEMPVLISGESGSGKSLIARVLHDYSDRRGLPFVSVTAADLAETDGPAQVLARARGGTVLLEAIDDLPQEAQARVVRMIDHPGETPPRFIAASPAQIPGELAEGRLRDDLYYRLSAAVLEVPALRRRVDDIPLLAGHFLDQMPRDGQNARRISPEAIQFMRKYAWPGNVRQLENVIRRLGLAAQESEISRAEVEKVIGGQPMAEPAMQQEPSGSLADSIGQHLQRYFDLHGNSMPPPGLYMRILREMEIPLIDIALDATGGNQAKCADLLGINRNTLRKKITEHDIRVTRHRKLM